MRVKRFSRRVLSSHEVGFGEVARRSEMRPIIMYYLKDEKALGSAGDGRWPIPFCGMERR